jgi:hypothetical protein
MLPYDSNMVWNSIYCTPHTLLHCLGQIYLHGGMFRINPMVCVFYFFTAVTAVGNACDCGGACLLVVTYELLASRTNI